MNEAVDLLSRYLKIDTTNPPGNEAKGISCYGVFPVLIQMDDVQRVHGLDASE